MTTFLVPTDFSPVAKQALTFAIQLAHKRKAKLEVLHVFDHQLLKGDLLPLSLNKALEEGNEEQATEQASLHVSELMNEIGVEVPFEVRLRTGYPRESIRNACLEDDCEMVIMGTTGATNRLEQFFGSTTSGVMLESGFPVLAIPPGTEYGDIRKIAYATNFREKSTKNFYELSRLAKIMDADVHCVHIETNSLTPSELAEEEELMAPQLEFDQMAFHVVQSKTVAEGLRKFIEDESIDMLAMEPRTHHFPDLLWKKSVTRKMVLSSQVPLLSLKG